MSKSTLRIEIGQTMTGCSGKYIISVYLDSELGKQHYHSSTFFVDNVKVNAEKEVINHIKKEVFDLEAKDAEVEVVAVLAGEIPF